MALATQDSTITLLSNYKNNMKTQEADISYLGAENRDRARLESFISAVFKKYYNAEIDHFYPNLLSIETADENQSSTEQSIKAVAGVRCAADEPLFSEYYLSNSLEAELETLYGKPIHRDQVVEVGNLAPANVGQMRWLIASITAFLYSAGYKYIVFTAVQGVYNAFRRMDIPLKLVTEAKQSCLPVEIKDKWGPEYYQLKPMVLAGDIVEGFDIMKKSIYSSNPKLIPLFEKAYLFGQQSMEGKHQRSLPEKNEYVA